MTFNNSIHYARQLDMNDELKGFRDRFVINDPEPIYMDGNSLGRMPKATAELIVGLTQSWGDDLIKGWKSGWFELSHRIGEKIANLIGAKPNEVIVADSTSINLLKLVIAVLRARPAKKFLVSDELNFPSDLHAMTAAIDLVGGAHHLRLMRSEDGMTISQTEIDRAVTSDVGLLLLSHTAFKSGFTYDIEDVTKRAHRSGALVLWDLSHSVGAMPIELGRCGVDLAVGSTYKYLNGGPGSPAFLYVREDLQKELLNPLAGWFGSREQFKFSIEHEPAAGITQFLTGTPTILSLAPIETGVDICLEAGMECIRKKSVTLTSYFIDLARDLLFPLGVTLNSPEDARFRGSHVSLGHPDAYAIDRALIHEMNVIPDFRHPDNIRFGMAPLYTSHEDVYQAVTRMRNVLVTETYKKYSIAIDGVT